MGAQGAATKKGISGSTLKIIAIVTMLIDHFGAIVLGRMLYRNGIEEVLNAVEPTVVMAWFKDNWALYLVYMVIRFIGRIAFPIFIFLMVEGLAKTGNRWKYLLRMVMFAVISEIPFDLAFKNQILEFTYQNVFFTLAIGLFAMIVCEYIEKNIWNKEAAWGKPVAVLLIGVVTVGAAILAECLKTDYGWIGIACIMAIYLFRKKKGLQIAAGCIAFIWEVTAPLAFIPIAFYNGERGKQMKYFFYAFYPVHLIVLYIISIACGLGAYIAG